MTDPLQRGSTIGILGGGQLGRMLSVAASRLGYRCHIYEPAPSPPAGHVAERVSTADYADVDALTAFGESVDVITFEFENVPTSALDTLETLAPIRPDRNALRISQDRLVEKAFLVDLGLRVAPHVAIDSADDLAEAVETLGTPAILKTRRFGYDGKGQIRLDDPPSDPSNILTSVGDAPSILEGFVAFDREISVIAARDLSGEISCFDPGENEHNDGILRTTRVPARIDDTTTRAAITIAATILEGLDYVGVLGVELFATADGLIVNEIAPRVHNSGHWTQDGCAVDQFEQHIRAIAGHRLGVPTRHSDVIMTNLLGDDLTARRDLLVAPNTTFHDYGKANSKPGRKMGHTNQLRPPTR